MDTYDRYASLTFVHDDIIKIVLHLQRALCATLSKSEAIVGKKPDNDLKILLGKVSAGLKIIQKATFLQASDVRQLRTLLGNIVDWAAEQEDKGELTAGVAKTLFDEGCDRRDDLSAYHELVKIYLHPNRSKEFANDDRQALTKTTQELRPSLVRYLQGAQNTLKP